MDYPQILAPVLNFLQCPTPQAWIDKARDPANLPLLLTDHMVCELKAAQTALHRQIGKSVMPKTDDPWGQALIDSMVLLIKEELHHFWQVRDAMLARDIPYVKITASRYAKGMLKEVRTHEPLTLIDKLICGAYIEARSCERFAALAPFLDDDLQKFYLSLLRSEARHYQDYLTLAQQVSDDDISPRIQLFGEIEATLISTPDHEFRFHSGVPV
ncbi:TPA: tRNA isopentenyl-2-thiomethyl-A-37 hydroxylase MiaE [Enterobacter hormaechei subsp. steigerwaltii]